MAHADICGDRNALDASRTVWRRRHHCARASLGRRVLLSLSLIAAAYQSSLGPVSSPRPADMLKDADLPRSPTCA